MLQVSGQPNRNNIKGYNGSGNYNAVPPPLGDGHTNNGGQRSKASIGGRGRERSHNRDRDDIDTEQQRKKRREERIKEREKDDNKKLSPARRRSRSPKMNRRSRIVPRYMVQIPKVSLDL